MPSYVIYDSADTGFMMSASTAPDFAKKNGWTAIGVGSLSDLQTALDDLLAKKVKIDQLRITTHGSPGSAGFGGDRLNSTTVATTLAGRGYEDLFSPNANVYFDGCNIGEGPNGSKFLKKVGEVFFIKVSGSVEAQTSLGFGAPFGLDVVHLWGDMKTMYYAPGPRLLEEFVQ